LFGWGLENKHRQFKDFLTCLSASHALFPLYRGWNVRLYKRTPWPRPKRVGWRDIWWSLGHIFERYLLATENAIPTRLYDG
jgi:hypothetical protein